jgi:hypothetical protein
LSRVEEVPARSMKRKGLEAKSWEQRSCGVGHWGTVGNGDCWGTAGGILFFLLRNIVIVKYILKRSQENSGKSGGPVLKWE